MTTDDQILTIDEARARKAELIRQVREGTPPLSGAQGRMVQRARLT